MSSSKVLKMYDFSSHAQLVLMCCLPRPCCLVQPLSNAAVSTHIYTQAAAPAGVLHALLRPARLPLLPLPAAAAVAGPASGTTAPCRLGMHTCAATAGSNTGAKASRSVSHSTVQLLHYHGKASLHLLSLCSW